MSRERAEDLEDDYEVSLGLSDMEKEDEEAIDGLADMLAPMTIAPVPVIEELRLVVYRKPKVSRKKLNLKNCVKSKGASKCRTSFSASLQSLHTLRTSPTSRL